MSYSFESCNEITATLSNKLNVLCFPFFEKTPYMHEVLQQLRADGYPVDEAHFKYLSTSRYEHIDRLDKYSFTNPAHLDPLHRRPLRQPGDQTA